MADRWGHRGRVGPAAPAGKAPRPAGRHKRAAPRWQGSSAGKLFNGRLGMGKILASLVFGAAVLGVASSEASAMNFVCQAVGPRSVAYGRAFFASDAKWRALLRCERYSGICIISYCVPMY